MMTTLPTPSQTTFFERLASLARESGQFGGVRSEPGRVHAIDPVQPAAAYRIALEDARLWVSWVSADRYLSQSIEAEVRWTGDDINELVDEELADQGWHGPPVGRFEHFRSEEKLFTFRSALPLDAGAADAPENALKFMLAYQAAFRNLGGMKPDDEG